MKTFTYVITDEIGIHARPAGMLVKIVKQYKSQIMLSSKGKSVDTRKLMAVMQMSIKKGDTVTLEIEGEDETKAFSELEVFFRNNL